MRGMIAPGALVGALLSPWLAQGAVEPSHAHRAIEVRQVLPTFDAAYQRHMTETDAAWLDFVAREGDAEWVSTSEALSGIVYAHHLLASAAERGGISVDQLVGALAIHGFKVAIPREVVEVGA